MSGSILVACSARRSAFPCGKILESAIKASWTSDGASPAILEVEFFGRSRHRPAAPP